MGKRKMNNHGMITIEACYIVPFTLMITMLLLWFGMYLYDCNVLSETASIAAICGSREAEKSNEEITELVTKRVEELLDDRLVSMDEPTLTVSVDYNTIQVTLCGQMEIPGIIFLTGWDGDTLWEFTTTQEAYRLRQSMITRTIHQLQSLSVNSCSNNQVQE
ncbi:MAG TPA: pilus assembly protein [Lachnospiraceae bacterium]|nr:pilus assembly protein [Lachnospiraceae bacterium]